jgi:hypothetical protein
MFLAEVSYGNDMASVVVHFVTARAITMKLGGRIPLGNTPRAFFDFFDFRNLTYFVASRQPS